MIKMKMTVNEAVGVVEAFIKHYKSFEQRVNDKYELERVLPKISNQTAVAALQKEINHIKQEEDNLGINHQLIVQQFVEYVFHNDFRKNLLVVETHLDTQPFKNNEGGYDDTYTYMFSGQLGKPLYNIMTLCSWYEFWGIGHEIPEEKQLNNTMSYQEFASVVNKYYIGEGGPLD